MSDNQYPFVPPVTTAWNSQPLIQMMGKEEEEEEAKGKPSATDADALGEGGKAALAAERKARQDAEKELAAFKKKQKDAEDKDLSEVQRLTKENEDLQRQVGTLSTENRQYRIGLENKVDPTLIPRLRGDDDDSMKADALELAKLNPGAKPAKADPSQGRKGDGNLGTTPKQDFEDAIDGLFDQG